MLAELVSIKRKRAEEVAQKTARNKADDETIRMESRINGNPHLNNATVHQVQFIDRNMHDMV